VTTEASVIDGRRVSSWDIYHGRILEDEESGRLRDPYLIERAWHREGVDAVLLCYTTNSGSRCTVEFPTMLMWR